MHQVLLENYGSPPWTYEMLPTVVKYWLLEECFTKDKVLTTAEEQASSIANVIYSEMAQLGRQINGSMKRDFGIQNALAGGL